MGIPGDDRYRSGDPIAHKDGREGVIVRPAGAKNIVVRFSGRDEVVDVGDLREVKRESS